MKNHVKHMLNYLVIAVILTLETTCKPMYKEDGGKKRRMKRKEGCTDVDTDRFPFHWFTP